MRRSAREGAGSEGEFLDTWGGTAADALAAARRDPRERRGGGEVRRGERVMGQGMGEGRVFVFVECGGGGVVAEVVLLRVVVKVKERMLKLELEPLGDPKEVEEGP